MLAVRPYGPGAEALIGGPASARGEDDDGDAVVGEEKDGGGGRMKGIGEERHDGIGEERDWRLAARVSPWGFTFILHAW